MNKQFNRGIKQCVEPKNKGECPNHIKFKGVFVDQGFIF